MKRVIKIPSSTGEVTVEADPMLGVMLKVELGDLTLSFGLHRIDARNLGNCLVRAAEELDGPDDEPEED